MLLQSCGDYEYVIVDGNSTDGTLAIGKSYKERIDVVISESDKGTYDATNKGLLNAYFLNAGDFFVDNYVLEDVSGY